MTSQRRRLLMGGAWLALAAVAGLVPVACGGSAQADPLEVTYYYLPG